MTPQQKQYIERKIELIEDDRWEEFFGNPPPGMGAVLYAAGVDFMSKMKKLPQRCFTDNDINSVSIPDNITRIEDYAFFYCTGLTSIIIPDSVTRIGDYAFEGCSSLTSISIPDSVTSIGKYAFDSCSLTSINFQGTKAQWNKITFGDNWNNSDTLQVICSDGIIDIT